MIFHISLLYAYVICCMTAMCIQLRTYILTRTHLYTPLLICQYTWIHMLIFFYMHSLIRVHTYILTSIYSPVLWYTYTSISIRLSFILPANIYPYIYILLYIKSGDWHSLLVPARRGARPLSRPQGTEQICIRLVYTNYICI